MHKLNSIKSRSVGVSVVILSASFIEGFQCAFLDDFLHSLFSFKNAKLREKERGELEMKSIELFQECLSEKLRASLVRMFGSSLRA
jgi:hypothetical protein